MEDELSMGDEELEPSEEELDDEEPLGETDDDSEVEEEASY